MRLRFAACLLVLFCNAFGQREEPERTLKVEEYGRWESLQQPRISRDGKWASYRVGVDENHVPTESFLKEFPAWGPRIVIRTTSSAFGSAGQEWVIPNGASATFSDDCEWVAYLIAVPKKEADKLREQKLPVENKLGVRNLETGKETIYDSVQSFEFLNSVVTSEVASQRSGPFLLAHKYRGAAKPTGGSDLVVVDLAKDRIEVIGNVVSYAPHPKPEIIAFASRVPPTQIALAIESDSGLKGVQVYTARQGLLRTVQWGKESVSGLRWSKDGSCLAFMSGTADAKKDGDWNLIKVVQDVSSSSPVVVTLDVKDMAAANGKRIVEFQPIGMNDDGSVLWFGLQDWKDKKKPAGKAEDLVGLDIWHWKDITVQPRQKIIADGERRRSLLAVWRPGAPAETALRVVGDESSRGVSVLEGSKHALLWEEKLYETTTTSGITYRDIHVVDLSSGDRTKVVARTRWNAIPSPGGKHLAYFRDKNWWVYDIDAGKHKNISTSAPGPWFDQDNDLTIPEKPPVSQPIWLKGGKGLVFYDKYDAWLYRDRAAGRLTSGHAKKRRHRLSMANADDDGRLSVDKPLYFSVFDTLRKDSGYAVLEDPARTTLKPVVFSGASWSGLQKARDAEVLLLTKQSFRETPNLYSIQSGEVTALRQLSSLNPQQREFAWGSNELIHYKNKWGKKLQGTLIYPAKYDSMKRYPMLVYIYEKLSDGFNSYIAPAEASAYNMQHFSQNGYFVLMPDIVYRPRNPGLSAQESLEPALDAAIKQAPAIDSRKIGLVGHSWGGYQTAFMLSKSKRFAAGVAGAPLTELISMYLSVYWNSGTPDQEIFETSQGRMEVPFWDDLKAYMDNSPVFNARNYTSPIMVAFGDKDGAVDWHQGLYLYNTLRRMGKDIIMLVYEGENHGLARRPNQLDYARRVRHFFDVHLKGDKPEPWIKEGVPFLKRGEG